MFQVEHCSCFRGIFFQSEENDYVWYISYNIFAVAGKRALILTDRD